MITEKREGKRRKVQQHEEKKVAYYESPREKKRKTKKKIKPEAKPFRLMDLSAELRNAIYRFCLVSPTAVRIEQEKHINSDTGHQSECWGMENKSRENSLVPSILLACKTIHREATPLLYGSNRFILMPVLFWDKSRMIWSDVIGSSVVYLRSVSSDQPLYQGYMRRAWGSLISAPDLEELIIRNWFFENCQAAEGMAKTLEPLMRHLHWRRSSTDKNGAFDVLRIQGKGAKEVKNILREELECAGGSTGSCKMLSRS